MFSGELGRIVPSSACAQDPDPIESEQLSSLTAGDGVVTHVKHLPSTSIFPIIAPDASGPIGALKYQLWFFAPVVHVSTVGIVGTEFPDRPVMQRPSDEMIWCP